MRNTMMTLGLTFLLATFASAPSVAQAQPPAPDAGLLTARMANGALKSWLTKAAEQMTEADFAFKPTPEARSFGQVLAHVAEQDYEFCAGAMGAKAPVRDLQKTATTKAEIQRALADAFAYCDGVYAGMTDAKAQAMVDFHGRPMPAVAVLLFRTHHNSLHYGNVATYMRLRGKVPPSSPSPISGE